MDQHQKAPNLDSLSTINKDGSKFNIHPADVKGSFTIRRRLTAWALIAVYIILPWIQINGYPAVFIDLAERRFHFFGLTLLTQDFWVFFFLVSGLAFALFVLASLVGRVWCGWFCPYTVFLEHLYRRIERFIDGDAPKRRKLDAAPMSSSKAFKRISKWGLYIIASCILAHIFLAYFISIPKVWENMRQSPGEHISQFLFILAFTGIFTFCFGWFREQFCIILCPYGRFQSALTDDQTVTVFYDDQRGEPRGKIRKNDTSEKGDCIDCRRCVQVCPTGIDIRNGLQLECVACSSCIDACNDIMRKVKRPTGLIRYDSSAGINTGKRKIIRPRILLYLVFTLFGLGALSATFVSKAKPFYAGLTRMRQTTYSASAEGVRNTFVIHITNKRNRSATYSIELLDSEHAGLNVENRTLEVSALGNDSITLSVLSPIAEYNGPLDIEFKVTADDDSSQKLAARFLGPNPSLYKEDISQK
ncbi:cytochrome c oxidase accessory protein CcoG [Rubritalea marina]|uniref:cytochrome c oxidase accessory protein CcoG n=1 Tax=Rubritalea marina TaxID=361055 RepID=UPI00039ACF5B|nr:cytochrome c oxidase accessory protein CcoG [Rubritalea marina]